MNFVLSHQYIIISVHLLPIVPRTNDSRSSSVISRVVASFIPIMDTFNYPFCRLLCSCVFLKRSSTLSSVYTTTWCVNCPHLKQADALKTCLTAVKYIPLICYLSNLPVTCRESSVILLFEVEESAFFSPIVDLLLSKGSSGFGVREMNGFSVVDCVTFEHVSMHFVFKISFMVNDVKRLAIEAIPWELFSWDLFSFGFTLSLRMGRQPFPPFNSWHSTTAMPFTSELFCGWSCHKCRLKFWHLNPENDWFLLIAVWCSWQSHYHLKSAPDKYHQPCYSQ